MDNKKRTSKNGQPIAADTTAHTTADAAFVAVDWGTSRCRLWSVSQDGRILSQRKSDEGMSTLSASDYAPVLSRNLSAMGITSECPAIICGMAGAAQGWCEAPYRESCEELFSLARYAVRVSGIERSVNILPGVKQRTPADVMRGEETQLLGLLCVHENFAGVVCLPGTHSKWVELQGGKIQRFTTHMTGELFALLSGQSVLKHSVPGQSESGQSDWGPAADEQSLLPQWNSVAFERAVDSVMRQPHRALEQLFSVRASTLLEHTSPADSVSRLSGLLIGIELAAMQRLWAGQAVALIGADPLCRLYEQALVRLGVNVDVFAAEKLSLAGLSCAFHHLHGTHS